MTRNRLPPALAGLVLCLSAAPAAACVFLPPEPRLNGETDEQFATRMAALDRQRAQDELGRRKTEQVWWFDTAREIMIAQVVGLGTRKVDGHSVPLVTLQAVRWLKGTGTSRSFEVSFTRWSSCGPSGGGDAPRQARLGGMFVIYDIGSTASERGELNVAVENALDPRMVAMLAEAGVR